MDNGETAYFLACRVCEPGIRPIRFETAAEREAWRAEHTAETGHDDWLAKDYPDDEWD